MFALFIQWIHQDTEINGWYSFQKMYKTKEEAIAYCNSSTNKRMIIHKHIENINKYKRYLVFYNKLQQNNFAFNSFYDSYTTLSEAQYIVQKLQTNVTQDNYSTEDCYIVDTQQTNNKLMIIQTGKINIKKKIIEYNDIRYNRTKI
jgi:hypothetical protein